MATISVAQDEEFLYISSNILDYRKQIGQNLFVLLCLLAHPSYNDLLIANELDMNLDEVISAIVSLQRNGFINYDKKFHAAIPRNISPSLRKEIMERDRCCVNCGSHDDLEIDHIVPVSKGGSSDIDNLQLLCKACNRKKANRMEDC